MVTSWLPSATHQRRGSSSHDVQQPSLSVRTRARAVFFARNRLEPRNLEYTVTDSTSQILHELMRVIEDRKTNPPERSYTTTLFAGGLDKIGAKILEEAHEVVDAAQETGPDGHHHTVREVADLLYHVFVLLGFHGIRLTEVEQELARRSGISGLDEKDSRHAE